MKHRSVLTVILLSFLTLGIYTLFWLRDTRKELLSTGVKVLPVKFLLLPFAALVGVTFLQFIVRFALVNASSVNDAGGPNIALNLLSVIVGIIAVVVVVPLTVFWFYRYCQAIEVVTNKQTSVGLSLGLLLIFSFVGVNFVWPGLIQDAFNKVPELGQPGLPPVQPF